MAAKKYLSYDNTTGRTKEVQATVQSAGSADDGKIVALDSTGRLDPTVLPTGAGGESKAAVASEALAAGDFVNFYSNSGALNIRKADATNPSKQAHGFVTASVASAAIGIVYFGILNANQTGFTIGTELFLSETTPGKATATAPVASGSIVQKLGVATATGEIFVNINSSVIQLA